jgi:hypothetical protein
MNTEKLKHSILLQKLKYKECMNLYPKNEHQLKTLNYGIVKGLEIAEMLIEEQKDVFL